MHGKQDQVVAGTNASRSVGDVANLSLRVKVKAFILPYFILIDCTGHFCATKYTLAYIVAAKETIISGVVVHAHAQNRLSHYVWLQNSTQVRIAYADKACTRAKL